MSRCIDRLAYIRPSGCACGSFSFLSLCRPFFSCPGIILYHQREDYSTILFCFKAIKNGLDMIPLIEGGKVVTLLRLSNRKPDAKIRIDVNLEEYYRIKDGN